MANVGKGAPTPKRNAQVRRRPTRAHSRRQVVIAAGLAGVVVITGVALTGALLGSGSTPSPRSVVDNAPDVSPSAPPPVRVTRTATPTAAPTATTPAPASASPTPAASATPRRATVAESCGSPARRMAAARTLLRHDAALPDVRVVAAGPREGVLSGGDVDTRTLTLYVRDCHQEPLEQLAVAWAEQAGQFVDVLQWDDATRARWRSQRGAGDRPWVPDLRRDVAAVYAYWQTGTTRWWASPLPPPTPSRLAELAGNFTG